VRIALAADDRAVTVTVRDDGVGLQSERARAGKAEAEITSFVVQPVDSGGTRSGLLTHGALIALIGGTLTAHSAPAQGTTVTIRVPRVGPEAGGALDLPQSQTSP
jgi:two-component system OmpR family sensor kinase